MENEISVSASLLLPSMSLLCLAVTWVAFTLGRFYNHNRSNYIWPITTHAENVMNQSELKGKTCYRRQARENVRPAPSAGKRAIFAKRGKTCNRRQTRKNTRYAKSTSFLVREVQNQNKGGCTFVPFPAFF